MGYQRLRDIFWVGLLLGLAACTSEPVKEAVPTKLHVITAVAGAGGSVTPKGDVTVDAGADRAFVILPDAGYQVQSVMVDGAEIGPLNSYTFQSVNKAHTLAVQFKAAADAPTGKAPRGQKPRAKPKPVAEVVELDPAPEPAPQPVRTKPAAKPKPARTVVADPVPAVTPAVVTGTPPVEKPVEKVAAKPPVEQSAVEATPKPAVTVTPAVAAPSITPLAQVLTDGMSAEDKGLAIVREADRRDTGFSDFRADIIMVLTNPNGDEVTRYINYSTLEAAGDGDKSLVLFNRPADIAGTALLTHSHKADADDQWLYLPALKRVKRISSANKSGSFVGSEFAYEDLSTQEIEKYQYKFLREESCGDRNCFVVDAYPVDAKSGYTRQERWIDQQDLLLRKVNYYDRKGDLLKTLEINKYQQYLGRYWRAEEYLMQNRQNNKVTRLLWKNYEFRSGLTADQFNPNALERGS